MAIDFPNSPAPGTNHTVDGKTWTFTDGKWALNVGVGGVQGPAGVAIQGTAPATTDVLWADTSDTGLVIVPAGGTTGQVLAKSSGTDYATAWATPVTSGDMALKANLASPTFTGTPTLPTGTIATTQTAGNSSTAIATTAFVGTAVANLVDSAPATLNTLDELALALGDDANFATTTATAIGLKAPLASPALTGTPTAPTAAVGTNTTQIATTEFITTAVSNISTGAVPNFLVYLSGGNSTAANGATIAYNTEVYDDTNNIVNGVFTVPAGQAGTYSFTAHTNAYNIGTSGFMRGCIVTTGTYANTYFGSSVTASGGVDHYVEVSLITKLAVGDTVKCLFSVPATGTYSAGLTYNNFSGARVA